VEGVVRLGGTEVMDEGVGFVQEDVVVDIIVVVDVIIIIVVFRLFLVLVHPLSLACSISRHRFGILIRNGEAYRRAVAVLGVT
jgi:hypothetical protein